MAAILCAITTACTTNPKSGVVIGDETTRVHGPVLPDGTVDYVEAYWEKQSMGVTEENNAAVLLQKAEDLWKPYLRGVPSGDRWDQMDHELSRSMKTPWNARQFQDVAAWLVENDSALDLFIAAAARPRLCPTSPPTAADSVQRLHFAPIRGAATALAARAMQRIAAGDFASARFDLNAMQQLAGLLAAQPEPLGYMVAVAVQELANTAELAAIRVMPVSEGKKWLTHRLESHGAVFNVDAIDIGQRYEELNNVMLILRGQAQKVIENVSMLNAERLFADHPHDRPMGPGDLNQVDWNIVLRHINNVCDDAVQIMTDPDLGKQFARAKQFAAHRSAEESPGNFFDAMGKSLLDPEHRDLELNATDLVAQLEIFMHRRKDETPKAFSARIARWITHNDSFLGDSLVPLIQRTAILHTLTTLAVALELYKFDTGHYPDTLAALSPRYLPQLPTDPYSKKTFLYRHDDTNCAVYSVGPNGIDDGGERHQEKDDIIVKSPADE
jgi:hypothetical protein